MVKENQSDKNLKELFFHVGLAKTGSTYLQNKFFHKLKGIKYIHTSEFYHYKEIIAESTENKLLFSREFDRQFFDETIKIAEKYPYAKILIVLRSNEKWIASQYRRYVCDRLGISVGQALWRGTAIYSPCDGTGAFTAGVVCCLFFSFVAFGNQFGQKL